MGDLYRSDDEFGDEPPELDACGPVSDRAQMLLLNRDFSHQQKPDYTLCLTVAISQDRVVSFQIIEGTMCAVLFENFLYQTVTALRKCASSRGKLLVIQLDNAVIHKTPAVMQAARRLGVVLLFGCPYSPFYASVEQVFNYLKTQLRRRGQQNTK